MIAVDTETTGLLYKEGVKSVFMVTWADAHGEYVCTEDTGWQPFLDALDRERTLVFANASFDVAHLRASGIVDLTATGHRIHDVQTLARIVLPGRFGYKLEELGSGLLGADSTIAQRELKATAKVYNVPWTLENKDYYGLWKLQPEMMEKYGKEDVRLTYDLWQNIWPKRRDSDEAIYRMEIAGVAPILREAEWRGMRVDRKRLAALRARLENKRDDLHERLLCAGMTVQALGEEGKRGSTIALRRDLLALGLPLHRTTPKGNQLSVNKDALSEFTDSHPFVSDLLEWRVVCKTISTYVRGLENADPRAHTSFSQIEARTGRMSSRQPNMQNLPTTTGIRDVLVPDPGNALIVADYSSIEVMVLASYINDPGLTAALEAGKDLYAMTAASVHGVPYEDCIKGGKSEHLRQAAKITTLTAMYGGGVPLLATRLGVPRAEAERIRDETLGSIPGYYQLVGGLSATVRARGSKPYLTTMLGRRLSIPRIKLVDADGNKIGEKTAAHVALNTLIQGGAAELMKLGLIATAPAIKPFGYGVVLVVHDEIVAEGPAEHADEALSAMREAMEGSYPMRPALKADGSWSTDSYGKAKH